MSAAKSRTHHSDVLTPCTLKATLTIDPITYISINVGPKDGANDFLADVRVVPAGRHGKRNLSTTMGHSTGLIREQCPVW